MLADVPINNPSRSQQNRLQRFSVEHSVDIHSHCLPGVDDGPRTLEDALALCRALVNDGITTVIATPHQLGAYEGRNHASQIREEAEKLKTALAGESIPLRILAGAEVRIDDQLLALLDRDQVLTIGDGGAYLLLELPHNTLVDLRPILGALADRGITGIISHPERHSALSRNPEVLIPWLKYGAILQLTSGSLVGDFGPLAEKSAWAMLSAGIVSVVASDAHDAERRPPAMTRAIDEIANRIGHAVARRLCIENPRKIMEGSPISVSRALAGQEGVR